MNLTGKTLNQVKIVAGVALLTMLTGCVGYVDEGYGGAGWVDPGPDVYLFGGGYYERGYDAHGYGHRGAGSRGGGGGHGGGAHGGGVHR